MIDLDDKKMVQTRNPSDVSPESDVADIVQSSSMNKVETLKRYKFSLAFENSNEEDYVTEKYFQTLLAGTVSLVRRILNGIERLPPGFTSIRVAMKIKAFVESTMNVASAFP